MSARTTTRRAAAPPSTDTPELADRMRRSLMRLARTLRYHDDDDLSPTLASALFSIDRAGACTLGELADLERMKKPTVTTVVDRLVERGLVRRRRDERDRRVCWVELTAAGKRTVRQRRERRSAWLARELELLSPADLRRLAAATPVLERLVGIEEAHPPA